MVNKLRHWYLWDFHPATTDHTDRSLGDRMADRMKAILATWTALFVVSGVILTWVTTDPGFDPFPYILLNLCLSGFAAVQCFVLLIANKRGEVVAAEIAAHTEENTEIIKDLLKVNTQLTQVLHDTLLDPEKVSPAVSDAAKVVQAILSAPKASVTPL